MNKVRLKQNSLVVAVCLSTSAFYIVCEWMHSLGENK